MHTVTTVHEWKPVDVHCDNCSLMEASTCTL